MNVNDVSHTCNFNGLSDLCNAYDTLGSRNFVQMLSYVAKISSIQTM